MNTKDFNKIYEVQGFKGVIQTVKNCLQYGTVEEVENGLYKICTCGWSEDERLMEELLAYMSSVRHIHYIGYLIGGAYYYAEDSDKINEARITLKTSEDKQ